MTQLLGSFGHEGSTSKTGMRWLPPCARLSISPRATAATMTSPSSVRQDVVLMRAAYTIRDPWLLRLDRSIMYSSSGAACEEATDEATARTGHTRHHPG